MTKSLVRAGSRLAASIDVIGLHHVPLTGGAILIANHRSMADGFLIYSLLNREIYPFIKSKYFRNRAIAWYLVSGGGIPVTSGSLQVSSLKRAIQLLRANQFLLIFPEGKINRGGGLLPFQPSFVRLALREEVPIIPLLLSDTAKMFHGASCIWRRPPISFQVFPPILLSQRFGKAVDPEACTHIIHQEMLTELLQMQSTTDTHADEQVTQTTSAEQS
jgi:1-acyl-sn-glycerol-3-phosphate acyltransferase